MKAIYRDSFIVNWSQSFNSIYWIIAWWLRWKRIYLQYRRTGLDPWVRKILWRRKLQPTLVFLPWKFYGREAWWATVQGVTRSRTLWAINTLTVTCTMCLNMLYMYYFTSSSQQLCPRCTIHKPIMQMRKLKNRLWLAQLTQLFGNSNSILT